VRHPPRSPQQCWNEVREKYDDYGYADGRSRACGDANLRPPDASKLRKEEPSMKSSNIVFVPGLFGWGPGELGAFPYWGDALQEFEKKGFKTHWAKCGPISSFHDRACEVFAHIKGTKVDYGAEHSAAEGHAQTSHDFTGQGHSDRPQRRSADVPAVATAAGGKILAHGFRCRFDWELDRGHHLRIWCPKWLDADLFGLRRNDRPCEPRIGLLGAIGARLHRGDKIGGTPDP
jgi:hypothetical protein